MARANPGSLWLIGNEPDRPAIQDDVHPENYARLYHDLYTFLKAQDPTCQVGVGGVVQPTPVRLKYLDSILDAYRQRYKRTLPVDVWNAHNYVLREKRPYQGCPDCWGADIPAGVPDDAGMLYELDDHDNMGYWVSHLIALRTWMRDNGYRDKPLVLSEYGILMPIDYGFDLNRVRAFLLATFDWLVTYADPDIGYPPDGNRLVQAWAWYSLDDDGFEGLAVASNLFSPDTLAITPLGQDFAAYTAAHLAPTVNLSAVGIRNNWTMPGNGGPIPVTVTADVLNRGSGTAQQVAVQFYRDGLPAGNVTIPTIHAGERQSASTTWPDLEVGQVLQVAVVIDPEGQLDECNLADNELTAQILVADHPIFLPELRWNP
jgi:hypothetical protein